MVGMRETTLKSAQNISVLGNFSNISNTSKHMYKWKNTIKPQQLAVLASECPPGKTVSQQCWRKAVQFDAH